ncbi:MAG: amidohydrolase family protein [Candidatus Brocadiia bacterium]
MTDQTGITDVHTHAFPDGLAHHAISTLEQSQDDARAVTDGTIGSLIRSMNHAGIQRSVVCSIATAPNQFKSILAWSRKVKGPRIIPLASVHPDNENPEVCVRKIAQTGLAGLKLHPQYQDFDLADPGIRPILQEAMENDLLVTFHCGLDFAFPDDDERAHPQKILSIHRNFPELTIIATHMGGWRRWDAVLEKLAGEDIYLETSYTFGYINEEILRKIIDRHPKDRLLFGTDSPWQDQLKTLKKVAIFFADSDLKGRLFVQNPATLFGPFEGTSKTEAK